MVRLRFAGVILSLFLPVAFSATEAATLYVSSIRAAPGDSLKPIRVALESSIPLAGAEFILQYDPTHISLDSIAQTPALASQTGSGANEFQPGKVAFLVFDLQGAPIPPSDSVDLFELWFSASDQAPVPIEVPLTITAASFVDEQLNYDSAFAGNGKMIICVCPCHADPVCDAIPDILDVVTIVDVAFRNVAESFDSGCPISRTDVNCDGKTDIFDVARAVNVSFRNADIGVEYCNPCGP